MSSLTNPPPRPPGSFSATVAPLNVTKRPPIRRVDSSDSEDAVALKNRVVTQSAPRPPYVQSQSNSSTASLQSFSRPLTATRDPPANRDGASDSSSGWHRGHFRKQSHEGHSLDKHGRKLSNEGLIPGHGSGEHGRKHSQTQGSFEAYLPTAANSTLPNMVAGSSLTASQIAAQAAMQQQQQQVLHSRQRSQTVPNPHVDTNVSSLGPRRPSRGPPTPVLSLTEASAPRPTNALNDQIYHGMLGGHQNAAQAAANVVFTKSPASPVLGHDSQEKPLPERPTKPEKSKVKLFSRPGKITIGKDKDPKSTALPSPSKLGQYTLASLQKMNMSTASVNDPSGQSGTSNLYALNNSSTATIRAAEPDGKDKGSEKHKHNFLSRQKHKLDHHLPLSSAASNSKPVDPSAPTSLYNFSVPPSPGPTTNSFAKSMSGLDLRHGGRALREKKKEERETGESSYREGSDWLGTSSSGTLGGAVSGTASSLYVDTLDLARFGLNNMSPDDAWPYLKAKLLIVFEGEDVRLPVEDLNRLVS